MGTNEKRRRRTKKQALFLAIIIVVLGVALFNYLRSAPTVEAQFQDESGKRSIVFNLEVAATRETQAYGLMKREEMATDHGMIFVFEREEPRSFWMKDTLIPLDMIFLNKNFVVLNIIERVPPLTEDHRKSSKPAKYVVELNAGVAAKEGIREGSVLRVLGSLPMGVS